MYKSVPPHRLGKELDPFLIVIRRFCKNEGELILESTRYNFNERTANARAIFRTTYATLSPAWSHRLCEEGRISYLIHTSNLNLI
jgi:hypothetical protein